MIEVLIAMGLFVVVFASIAQVAVDVRSSDLVELQRTRAEGLLNEQIAALRTIHQRSWSELVAGPFPAHPEVVDNRWVLSPGPQVIDSYTRQISMAEVGPTSDPSNKKFTVTVSWATPRQLTISKEIWFSRSLRNSAWLQDTVADFVKGSTNSTEVTNQSGGEVRLVQQPAQDGVPSGLRGNRFGTLKPDKVRLDDQSKKLAFRFTGVNNARSVNAIQVYIDDAHSNPPTYRFGLQGDIGGKPSGQWLGHNNRGYKDLNPTQAGWLTLTLQEPVTISSGGVYHLVVEYRSGQINQGHYIELRMIDPLNRVHVFDGSDDPNLMTLTSGDSGFSWSELLRSPLYILVFGDTQEPYGEGNPYHLVSEISISNDGTANQPSNTPGFGQNFVYSGETKTISKLSTFIYIRSTGSPPEDNLSVRLVDYSTCEVLAEQVFATPDQVTTNYQLLERQLTRPVTLTNGRSYRLYFFSSGTSFNRGYIMAVGETLYLGTNTFDPWDHYVDLTYGGQLSRYSKFPSLGAGSNPPDPCNTQPTNWQDDIKKDIFFQFSAVAETEIVTQGDYTSATFDPGNQVGFNRIDWLSDVPTSTELKFQIAVNEDNATWNYVGPDGRTDSFFTATSPRAISPANAAGRYFRFKAYFTSNDPTKSPVLEKFTLNYSP